MAGSLAAYAEFLANKQARHRSAGVTVDSDEIHSSLHDWQKRIVVATLARGRGAVFADTGLGKTRMQLEWCRLIADRALILAPLSVARQSVREAIKIDVDMHYVRRPTDVVPGTISITNYELAHHFDPDDFDAIALDESSILKNFTGATRNALIRQWADTAYRSTWSATPAPNDVTELCNQAEFLGVMPRNEMLAAYFVHDDEGWRLKGHAIDPMFRWMATWAIAARRPSDVGGDDAPYTLPALNVRPLTVRVEIEQDGQLFATDLGGVGGRAAVRRSTLIDRVDAAVELINHQAGRYDNGDETSRPGLHEAVGGSKPRAREGVSSGDPGPAECSSTGTVRRRRNPEDPGAGAGEGVANGEPGETQGQPTKDARTNAGGVSGDARSAVGEVRDLRIPGSVGAELLSAGGSLPLNGPGAGLALHELQPGAGQVSRRSPTAGSGHGLPEEPWIIWCGLNQEQDALANAFGDRAISIYGSLSPDEKETRLLAWLDGAAPILISKPSICGMGLNLQRAHRMVFVGLSDSWESYYQAIRRCWRFGQTKPVEAHVVVSELEQQIVANVRSKETEVAAWVARLIYYMNHPEVAA